MAPRKRFSAFDDFPVDNNATEPKEAPAPLFQETPHVLTQPEPTQVERIERLAPSQIIPDRFQPRRLLPSTIRPAFFSGEINCYQAAAQWLEMAKSDNSIKNETDRLLAMGSSFEAHGQIKPITGSWKPTQDGAFIFQIETGERRFWAACLQYVTENLSEEPALRVEVVKKPTRQRQVLENQHAEAPSDVGRACEVAALILSELEVEPPTGLKDEYDFFRMARHRDMTGKLWEKLQDIMQISRPRMIQFLNILALPNPLLELADQYRVPERVLREILRAAPKQRETLLVTSIKRKLTSDQVSELAQNPKAIKRERSTPSAPPDPAQGAINAYKRFIKLMEELDETIQSGVLDELADDFVSNGKAEGAVNLMGELARMIQIRDENMRRPY